VRALLDAQAGADTTAAQQPGRLAGGVGAAAARRAGQRDTLERERERLAWQAAELDKLAPQPTNGTSSTPNTSAWPTARRCSMARALRSMRWPTTRPVPTR
jgi:hypothetical protein